MTRHVTSTVWLAGVLVSFEMLAAGAVCGGDVRHGPSLQTILVGLKPLRLSVVLRVKPAPPNLGAEEAALRAAVIDQLRRGGVPLFTEPTGARGAVAADLDIAVDATWFGEDACATVPTVTLREPAVLSSSDSGGRAVPQTRVVATWGFDRAGVGYRWGARADLRHCVFNARDVAVREAAAFAYEYMTSNSENSRAPRVEQSQPGGSQPTKTQRQE